LYFGNAQAVRADATNNAGTLETETEKQTTTPNMSNGTKVTLSDNSKVTNASNETSKSNNGNTDETSKSNNGNTDETSKSNNGNTDQSDITTTTSNNESTQNSIGKVQENGQKSKNSITQTIDTDNVNNASQAVPYSKLFVNNLIRTNVINGNSISTITRKSTDRRYSLTFKSYGVMGQNGSTVPDSAFINEKITFPLLLQGHIQNGDTVVITIPYADTYTVNAQRLSSQ